KFIHKEMCPEASEFLDINYAEVAKAFGAYGERVTSPDALKPALRRAEESGMPALIDVAISREVVPPVSRYEAVTKREL
ncbi:MAG: thiamine pyrophosphate-dependent enzyme, partial [Candidatus Binatia bacterium]